MASNRVAPLTEQKATLLQEKASTLDFIRRLREGGNDSQAAIQERNVLRVERAVAQIEGEIARELSR
jgi:hypothetical protein